MRYIYFISDEDRYWIEVDNDGIAVRQIILSDGLYHISALEDCLAEGKVVDEEIDGDVTDISRADFEHVWEKTLEEYRPVWNSTKQRFKINDFIMAELAFYYPQGKIFKIDNILVNYIGNKNVNLHEKLRMKIIGYDDTNMWIVAQ